MDARWEESIECGDSVAEGDGSEGETYEVGVRRDVGSLHQPESNLQFG